MKYGASVPDRPFFRHLGHALLDDPHALPHLLDADEIAVERVAAGADRDLEVDPVVDVVRVRDAQVPLDAAAPEIGPRHRGVDRQLRR